MWTGGEGRAKKASAGAPRRPVQEIVRAGQAETVILIILIILWIILFAFHPYLEWGSTSLRGAYSGLPNPSRGLCLRTPREALRPNGALDGLNVSFSSR